MDRQHTQAVVLKVLTTVLEREVDRTCSRQNTPQWDSLKHIAIVFAVEDELNVQFLEDELATLDNAEKIVDAVLAQHAT